MALLVCPAPALLCNDFTHYAYIASCSQYHPDGLYILRSHRTRQMQGNRVSRWGILPNAFSVSASASNAPEVIFEHLRQVKFSSTFQ
jgi:hypothetical protein